MATQLGAIKRVRGFPGVNVDGFNYQSPDVTAYFLTHYHADHTCGLHAGFKGPAPIYCTPPTAALLTAVTGVRPSLVRAVAVGDDAAVPLADGGEAVVTFLDANHCPGSALLHFRHRSTNRVVLHTGDFRASRAVRDDPLLAALLRAHGRVDELMLDTTYCDPRWTFPDRDVACEAMAEIVRRELRREPRTLFLVGSYAVGKERAVRAVARAAGTRAGVGWHRARTLKLTGWWDETLFVCEDDERAVEAAMREEAERERRRRVKMLPRGRGDGDERADAEDPSDPSDPSSGENLSSGDAFAPPACRARVTPMGGGAPHEAMAEMMERTHVDPRTNRPWFRAVVSFRPTGWSYARGRGRARGGAGAGAAREEAGAERGNDEAGEKGVKEEGVKEEGVKEEGVKEEGVKEEVNASVKVSEVKPEVIEAEVASAGIRAGAFSSPRAVSVASGSSPSPASLLADACRPWVENGGATRCYSVPYSEHSSFDELVAFVERVRPARVTPTVNAATRGDRERLLRHFLRFTDARADPGKLDHYFIKGKAPEVTKREEERVASELGTRGAAGGGGEREKGASAPPGASLPRPLPDPEDEAPPPAHDPDALAAVRAALDLDPSELRQQEALWRAAKDAAAREKMREDANGGADLGAFPLGCVALVRGGGGGGGGLGPGAGGGAAFAHFRDRAHVEDRLRALGATIVKRLSPKVTHVVVPSGGEALAEERRKHRSVAGGRRAADADPKTPKGSSKGGDENTRDELGRPPSPRPPLALPGVGEAGAGAGALETDAGARGVDSASDSPPPGPAPRVVTESWVMRHWRAREAGVAETHSASAIDAHRRAARESRRREADETKKRKARELASGVEVRPGRPRAMSKATLDRVARALSQRLFLIRRVDRSRGDADASESPRTDRGNNGNLPPREDAAAHATTKPGGTHPSSGTWHSSFAVFGSTGNAYECEVRATPSCTCPDFVGAAAASSGRRACKHLLWVYMRVLGVSRDDPLLAQAHLLQAELEAMLACPSAAQRAQSAAASVRAAYRAAVVSAEEEEEEEDVSLCAPAPARRQPLRATAPGEDEPRCPVCFDDIVDAADRAAAAAAVGLGGGNPPESSPESPKNDRRVEDEGDDADPTGLEDGSSGWTNYATKTRASVWWCSAGCGGNVHARCAEAWFAKSGDRACPLCRAPWLAQAEGDVLGAGWALPGAGTGATLNGGAAGDAVEASAAATGFEASPGGAMYVNLRRFQAGTAAGRDLEQYGSFARRAIEKREREERRKSRDPEGG